MSSPERFIVPCLVIGVAGLVLMVIAFAMAPAIAFRLWLLAALFFTGLSLGALVLLMIHHMTGGRWSEILRPYWVAMAGALPLSALTMAVPIAGMSDVLPWIAAGTRILPDRFHAKLAYLDPPFLIARTVLFFAIWLIIAWLVGLWSVSPQRRQPSRCRPLRSARRSATWRRGSGSGC